MTLGYVGLGKMGHNMVTRLLKKGHRVVVFDTDRRARRAARSAGAKSANSLQELVATLKSPRLVWVMVPHAVVDDVLHELIRFLRRGDAIIDGGNSFYERSRRRAKKIERKGVNFIDVGVSGGPGGALHGACLMVGGKEKMYRRYMKLFRDLAQKDGFAYAGKHGAGHFVKMVHNGIEYGMMQALAEGFAVMKKSSFRLPLKNVARLYNHGSVIESRLVGWLEGAFAEYGENLQDVSGTVAHTGEGEWTIKTARKLRVPAPVIKGAFDFRVGSKKKPSYTGKVLSALRNQFGGHSVE